MGHFRYHNDGKKKAQVYLHYNVRLGNIQMKIKCNLYNGLIALNGRIKFDYRF